MVVVASRCYARGCCIEPSNNPRNRHVPESSKGRETHYVLAGFGMYLYRAVDWQGNTLEFLLSPTRDAQAAKRFFSKTLAAPHTTTPRVITADKNAASPKAFNERQAKGAIPDSCELRQVKSLNNIVEQDHRFIQHLVQRRVKAGLGFFSPETTWNTLQRYEVMNMVRKERAKARRRTRRNHRADCVHLQPVWSG